LLIGIDQGTSGTTAISVDEDLNSVGMASRPIITDQGADGRVEQDPWQVLASVVEATAEILASNDEPIAAAGFDHQGETVLAWDRATLEPLSPAMVWSDRRASAITERMVNHGLDGPVSRRAGTRLDPYFCAAKYRWMLDTIPGIGTGGDRVALGTLDTWILAQLGAEEATDVGTASRTQLTALGGSDWDADLLDWFGIPRDHLAPILPSLHERGTIGHPTWPVRLPLMAVVVDQPAALVGNGCLTPGSAKITYGTGAFVVVNAGRRQPPFQPALIRSVGWADRSGPVFTLDGGVLAAGAGLRWLGQLGVDVSPAAQDLLPRKAASGVRLLPALDGLGAPHWDREVKAVVAGLTSATTGADLLQAYLDAIAFRIREILDAARESGVEWPEAIRVDGGLTKSAYLMQKQADVLGIPVAVSGQPEATALGAAYMAGLALGSIDESLILESVGPVRSIQPGDSRQAASEFEEWTSFASASKRI
jgi:glycerol kinase